MPTHLIAHKGLPFAFVAELEGGIAARYTQGVFQARDLADESRPLLLEATTDAGTLVIDHDAGTVSVALGATATESLPVTGRTDRIKAQIRLYDPGDADDTIGGAAFDLVIAPEVIDD